MIFYPKKHNHLGDLINICQYNDFEYIYHEEKRVTTMLEFLAVLFSNKFKVLDRVESLEKLIEISPTWTQKLDNEQGTLTWNWKPYKKIEKKNYSQKTNEISCQFDFRSKCFWEKGISKNLLNKIVETWGTRLVNIGDKDIEGIKNKTDAKLEEKLKIINESKFYIGIDSGLSHLALMTATPSVIVYSSNKPSFFYPINAQFADNIGKIKQIINNKSII